MSRTHRSGAGCPCPPSPPGRRAVLSLGMTVAVAATFAILVVSGSLPGATHPHVLRLAATTGGAVAAAQPASGVAPAIYRAPQLALGTSAAPYNICALGSATCTAGTGVSRVTLTAQTTAAPAPYWPDVQVAFVIETTAYDGTFDHYNSFYGNDPCAIATNGQGPLCEESNGVPFFIDNAQSIAAAIQIANPHSNVSFAMVDFFGTDDDWNDGPGDSWKYHVDISDFVGPTEFGSAVVSNFKDVQLTEANGYGCICGLDDNFLHSSSITALYGTIIGSGLTWSANTHHVIVLMGSAAPRDPSYQQNYWVSGFDHCCSGAGAYGGTCEPTYVFANDVSPNCEGWVRSQDGNATHSIAALTRTSPTCTDSIGHVCTVDVIDYWTTTTDPYSKGWPTDPGYPSGTAGAGPGGSTVIVDAERILVAGCDLAAATGGSWDGPAYFTCPSGQSGTLQYVPHGSLSKPNSQNPSLFAAIRQISFGPVYQTLVARGGNQPMFTYVPTPNFKLAPTPEYAAACSTPSGFLRTCQTIPQVIHSNGVTYLGWNWSTNATDNVLYVGDTWLASFNVVNAGPPYGIVPVIACVTTSCKVEGSTAVGGFFSWTDFYPGNTTQLRYLSFPPAQVHVLEAIAGPPPVTVPPSAPIVPPGIPLPVAPVTPVVVPTLTVVGQGVANFSLQAAAAGFLGAGFMRVGMKNRPIALAVAAKSGFKGSKFDKSAGEASAAGVGRFD
ncbi:MAG: hypothetical protein L3K15_07900 [Thermoplasmata archaeon]|nr:hypothetical protein [Thermoplasmata archaeon]